MMMVRRVESRRVVGEMCGEDDEVDALTTARTCEETLWNGHVKPCASPRLAEAEAEAEPEPVAAIPTCRPISATIKIFNFQMLPNADGMYWDKEKECISNALCPSFF